MPIILSPPAGADPGFRKEVRQRNPGNGSFPGDGDFVQNIYYTVNVR